MKYPKRILLLLIIPTLFLFSCDVVSPSEKREPVVWHFSPEYTGSYGPGDSATVKIGFWADGDGELSHFIYWIEGSDQENTPAGTVFTSEPISLDGTTYGRDKNEREYILKFAMPSINQSGIYDLHVRVTDKSGYETDYCAWSIRIEKLKDELKATFGVGKGLSSSQLINIDKNLNSDDFVVVNQYDDNKTYSEEIQKKSQLLINIDYTGDKPIIRFYSTWAAKQSGKFCQSFWVWKGLTGDFKLNPISMAELNITKSPFKLEKIADNSNAPSIGYLDFEFNEDWKNGIVLLTSDGGHYYYICLKAEEQNNVVYLHQKYIVLNNYADK